MLRYGKYLLAFVVFNTFLSRVPCFRHQARVRAAACSGDERCVIVTSCPSAMSAIPTGLYPKLCGWAAQVPFICCPPDSPATTPPTETLLDLEEKSGRFIGISPDGCGVRIIPPEETLEPRTDFPLELPDIAELTIPPIQLAVGGNAATHKWPWMVAIYDGNKKKQLCGGALIDEKHVLTAAHCFAGKSLNPNLYSVQVGELEISETIPHLEVEDVKTHEGYRPRYDYDDIALLRLSRPCDAVPACLPLFDDITPGDNVTILGWGDLSFGGPSSNVLQEVKDIPVVGNGECDKKFQKIAKARFPRGIWEGFLCAGLEEGGKDACQGDSGGPLLKQGSQGAWSLVGIVSFGYKCGEPGFPGVYTRVSAYIPWINANMVTENEVSMEMRKAKEFDYIDGSPVWSSPEELVLFPGAIGKK